ncbi:MAG: bifunctional demethylmenaquinone methyltransferase/2-methoxy-6-polyprenyl-1,4-benzoquinol methylase UbiE [Nitrospiraceae bacterium]|nr:bifunctional demethylmenaquinone methyltransferase/2-methoxy-6-polyprenyl-1,4-benzoquinol methylase UbiE [Nitrospiraceae bacterium]
MNDRLAGRGNAGGRRTPDDSGGGWPGRDSAPLETAEQRGRDIFIQEIFASIASDIDFLSSFFSFGLDQRWRRRLVSLLDLKGGERILDVCTGTGKLAFLLARKVRKGGSVRGVDFSREMLGEAQKKLGARSPNISFGFSDAKALDFAENSFDAVTVSFGMRNIPDTASALRQAFRVLKPGGRFCCLELTPPTDRRVKPLYEVYCFRVMPFIAMRVLKTAVPYNYLPRSIRAFPSRDEFRRTLEDCGFTGVSVHSMTFGIATIFEARKAG